MKILVFSDSHGEQEDMILTVEAEQPDAVFHLGDVWRDGEELEYAFPNLLIYQVPGNCDWRMDGYPTERTVELGGVRFLLCHGHVFGVKSGYSTAVSRARLAGADVLLCGHTHDPFYQDYGGLQLLNPGSTRYSHTYGRILVETGIAACSIQSL